MLIPRRPPPLGILPRLMPACPVSPCFLDVRRRVERASAWAGALPVTRVRGSAGSGGRERAGRRLREGRRAMAGAAAARESVTIAGRPERVAVARAVAAAVLGRQHSEGETAVLLLSELVTNSIRHSGSCLPGQTITVTVLSDGKVIRIEVTDRRSAAVPALRSGDAEAESGRGLYLVDTLAARWGFDQDGDHTTTWFELRQARRKSTEG